MKMKYYLERGTLTYMNSGFWIKKLVLESDFKESVVLSFEKGLNIVAGASNTGKSYIFECINYVLGSKDKPKDIIEAKDYSRFILEVRNYNGIIYTIVRERTGKIFLYECKYEDKNINNNIELIQRFNPKNENNISSKLMDLCDMKYKKIIKNASGITNNFTFREFIHMNMLSEDRIISSKSIIYNTLGNTNYTKNKSVFRCIVTGKDDSDIDGKLNKSSKKTSKDVVMELIKNLKEELDEEDLKKDLSSEIKNIEIEIAAIQYKVDEYTEIISAIEEKLELKRKEQLSLKESILYCEEMEKRFTLLKKNYESDMDRLEFINESQYYINQLIDLNCPICSGKIEVNKNDEEEDDMAKALLAERRKLIMQISDLESVILDSKIDKDKYINESKTITNEIEGLKLELDNQINLGIKNNISELNKKMEQRENLSVKSKLIEKINKLIIMIDTEDDDENNINTNKEIESKILQDICELAKSILIDSNVINRCDISFNPNTMDLKIDGLDKNTYGKGYKALINSAFTIAINEYTYSKGLSNAGFIVLDSPLTAFKDKDSIDVEVNEAVKTEFYKTLSKKIKNIQIIILDNVEPPEEIKNKIKCYHFTGNEYVGRAGFITM